MRVFDPESRPEAGWRRAAYTVIFETDTRAGKLFDVALLGAILLSIVAISLETVADFELDHGTTLRAIEWVLTGLFTIEYVMRLIVVREAKRYALSFMGIVDLLSLLPTYLSLGFDDAHVLQILRALRLLRVFRVFQLGTMANEAGGLFSAVIASRYKVSVFLGAVMIIVVIQGALLYYLEHDDNDGFSSIPRSIYWAIVTLTTVGYGDIAPKSIGGQVIASILMLLGYGIIAVPTGIVTAEVALSEYIRREAEESEHVVIHSETGHSCASSIPAVMIVQGAADAGVTTLSHGVRVEARPEPEPEPEPEPPS